ncbi:hypothetical protein TrVE_jg8066 [Triparma verrucosa]|uniref:Uncharacterized protein n=1 Tax=Triparma verrucosa TaxID=1606542 RepID=A0A9W7BF31_9STRA|nr:hypothetical protein TrVE_jg8066 [Triparma verrucosa]
MQFRTSGGVPLSHGSGGGGKRSGRSRGRSSVYRTTDSLADAVGESPEFSWVADVLRKLDVDGSLVDMLKKAEDLDEIVSGKQDKSGTIERLRLLRFLKHEMFEPLEPLPEAKCTGDELIFHWINNPSVDIRSRILIMSEAVMLLCGLLLTVSADALFTNPCVMGESATRGAHEADWARGTGSCTNIESADLMLWCCMLAMEAAALGSAAGNCNIISFLNDDDLRTYVMRNWVRYQSAQSCMTWTTMFVLPSAILVRLSLHAPNNLVYASGAFLFFTTFCFFMGNWSGPFRSATRIALPHLRKTGIMFGKNNWNDANNIFIGMAPHKFKVPPLDLSEESGGTFGAAKVAP